MRIVLIQDGTGQKAAELAFDIPVVKMGRDTNQCPIAFDQDKYPMVSRVHAELRCRGPKWFVFDNASTYGTYLNGFRVQEEQTLEVGSTLQLGVQGPMLIIVEVEGGAEVELPPEPVKEVVNPPAPVVAAPIAPPASPREVVEELKRNLSPAPSPAVENKGVASIRPVDQQPVVQSPAGPAPVLEFASGGRNDFRIEKRSIIIGRDPQCDLVIDSTAIMVSRRHAEIILNDNGWLLKDNGSFNGTLVNGHRISELTVLNHDDKIQLGPSGPILRFKLHANNPEAGGEGSGNLRRQAVIEDQKVYVPEQPDIFNI